MYSILFSNKKSADDFASRNGGSVFKSAQGKDNYIVYKGTNEAFISVYRTMLTSKKQK